MSKFFPLKLRGVSNFQLALLSVFWLTCISTIHLSAQDVPDAINYQAIVRDSETLFPISDRGAYVSVEFLDGPDGDVLYQEEFSSIQTGKTGLINLSLGQGNPLINTFEEIAWETGNIWLRLSVDIGNGLNILQETPFNTVPYAFFAKSSGSSESDGDGDSTNELIDDIALEGASLVINEGDQIQTVDLSTLREDDDADPSNEIQSLSLTGTSLTISGNESTVDLSDLPGIGLDADSDPSNELQELELVENNLSITNSPNNSQVDLSPYLDNTDNQDLTLAGSTLSLSGDGTPVDLSTVPGIGNDADADSSNELQDLELSGNELTITNNPLATPVDLSLYLDNTDNQDLSLSGTTLTLSGDGTPVDLSGIPGLGDDADADPSNEIQDLSLTGSTLSLSGDGTPVDLSSVPGIGDDADADPSNELQDIELSGNELSLTNNPLATPVDLSLYLDNTDNQDLSLSGTTLTLSGDGTPVDLSGIPGLGDDADADPSNEIQDLSLTGSTLSLSGDGTPVDLSSVPGIGDDADADPSNELQDIELSGNELSLTNNPLATPVDLSLYLDNTDNQDLSLSGTTLTLSGDGTPVDLSGIPGLGDDADADPSNEIQDLSLTGSTLSLSGDGTTVDLSTLPGLGDDADADPSNELQDLSLSNDILSLTGDGTAVDLSDYDNSELSQNHIFLGDASGEAQEVNINGDVNLANNGEVTVTGIQSTQVSNVTPVDGQILVYDAGDAEWKPKDPDVVGVTSTQGFYSIDPLDFRELTDPLGGTGVDKNNAVKFYNEEAPFAFIRNESNFDALGAPVHLPHGATVTQVRVYFRDTALGFMQFRLVRKSITTVSNSNQVMADLSGFGAVGNVSVLDNTIINNVIDNGNYNYRFIAEFTYQESDNSPDLTLEMNQRIYGVVITYTID